MELPPALELMVALSSHIARKQNTNSAFQLSGVKSPPGPSYDLAFDLARDPLLCLQHLKDHYGSTVSFTLASQPIILVTSPKLSKEVLVTKSKTFVKNGTAFFPGSSLTGNGLLVSDGEIWLRQRRLCNPAFRKCIVDTYAQAMVDTTSTFVKEKWQRSCIRDVYSDFNDLTMEIVIKTLFGGASATHSYGEVVQAITTAFKSFTRRATSMFIVPEWIPTPENVEFSMAIKKLDSVVYSVIQERRAILASNSLPTTQFQDLLTQLLLANDDDHSTMSDQHLRDELMTMLIAGQETSAILLAWCMQMLAVYPLLQDKLYMEMENVVGERLPSHTDIASLPYTEAFVLETMRLMPPAYIIGRCANMDTLLGPWEVPKGTSVLIGIYLLHRDPLYWERPLEFDPSRWLRGKCVGKHFENPSYWPFGGGPRTCIAMGFAMMEACLVLCITVQKFKVSLPDGVPMAKPRPMITLRPEDKVELELIERTKLSKCRHS